MNLAFNHLDQGRYLSAQRFAEVQAALRGRARRREHLCSELLTEPAWDILLELYAYELLQRRPTIAELVARINVPDTTSLRWIKMLEAEDLVSREVISHDTAEACAHLTRKGLKAMDGYFSGGGSDLKRVSL